MLQFPSEAFEFASESEAETDHELAEEYRMRGGSRAYRGSAAPRSSRYSSGYAARPGTNRGAGRNFPTRSSSGNRRQPPRQSPYRRPYGWSWPQWPMDAAGVSAGQPPFGSDRGAVSEFVRWVQSTLNQVMGLQLRVDGRMNRATRNAIRGFQRRRNLSPDGFVGPGTRRALLAAQRGRSSSAPRQEPPPGSASVDAPAEPASADAPAEPAAEPASADASAAQELEWYPGTAAPTPIPAGPAVAGLRAAIVRIAKQELARWGNGTIKETDPRVRQVLQDYWATGTGNQFSAAQLGSAQFQESHPWSAAFISWVMQRAGASQSFRRSASHAVYIQWAKENRLRNLPNPFKAYRVTEAAPRVGDLVCKSRSGSGATYDTIQPGMKTHCDIVTEVRPGQLVTVGGNVSQSVAPTTVRTNANGFIRDPGYFAVIRYEDGSSPRPSITPPSQPTRPAASSAAPASLAPLVAPSVPATIQNALAIVKAISAFHGIPWQLGYTILQHEGGVRRFSHHDGVMQTTRDARQATIPRIPRPLKLSLLGLRATNTTSDAALNSQLEREFQRRLAIQIATGIQELKTNLDRFNGYVALAFQAYNAGAGWAYYTVTSGRSKSQPQGIDPTMWETMCRLGASLLHKMPNEVDIGMGVWQCDKNIPAWSSHIPVRDRHSGRSLIAYKYLRSITEQIRGPVPNASTCTPAVHGSKHRQTGTGPLIRRQTRDGALDKLYHPRKLGAYYTAAPQLSPIPEDNLPLKVLNGRLVKMPSPAPTPRPTPGQPRPDQEMSLPWTGRSGLRPKPQYLRFMSLDQFNSNQASLTPLLRQMAGQLAKHVQLSWKSMRPIGLIRLIGHTDNTGPEKYNVALGDGRARAVKAELESIFNGRVQVAIIVEPSRGASAPTADNRTPKGRALNRRVEVFIAPAEPQGLLKPPDPPESGKSPKPSKPTKWPVRDPSGRSVIQTTPEPYWQPVPTLPPGKSFKQYFDDKMNGWKVPKLLRNQIWDAVFGKDFGVLNSLLNATSASGAEKKAFLETVRTLAEKPAR